MSHNEQPLTLERVSEILAEISKPKPEMIEEALKYCNRYFEEMPTENLDISSYYDMIPPEIYEQMMNCANFKELDKISLAAW